MPRCMCEGQKIIYVVVKVALLLLPCEPKTLNSALVRLGSKQFYLLNHLISPP